MNVDRMQALAFGTFSLPQVYRVQAMRDQSVIAQMQAMSAQGKSPLAQARWLGWHVESANVNLTMPAKHVLTLLKLEGDARRIRTGHLHNAVRYIIDSARINMQDTEKEGSIDEMMSDSKMSRDDALDYCLRSSMSVLLADAKSQFWHKGADEKHIESVVKYVRKWFAKRGIDY